MKSILSGFIVLALFSAFNILLCTAHAQGTSFTYQGRLNDSGSPANGSYDLIFTLFATNSTGEVVAGPVTNSATTVSNGLFTATIDFGPGVFIGGSNWLELAVSTNGADSFTTLAPRQQITPTPYAITAANLSSVVENDSIQGEVSLATIGGGGGNAIQREANYSTISGGQQNLIQSNAAYSGIVGGIQNQVGAEESVIGGGYFNIIQTSAFDSIIGGGSFNTIQSNAQYSTIGGGGNNNIFNGMGETIGGGEYNASSNSLSTVGGGYFNTSVGSEATVSGGIGNTSSGDYSTVPGGAENVAAGRYSFAAGYFAQALHDGAFVWSDYSDLSGVHFSSTGNNQFSVRAVGGVRFVTGGAGMTLDNHQVLTNNQSSVILSGTFNGNGGGLTLNAGSITSGTLADARLSANVALLNANQTFTGTTNTFAGDLQLEGGAAYHHLELSGGNSIGYLYGSYPAFGDGVHLGYNYYADVNGFPHVPDIGGGTSRITAAFGEILLSVGGINSPPSNVRLDATMSGVTVYGTFNNLSDRNAKQDFAPVSPSQMLDKVLRLPVNEWSYKVDAATRHIGPVAQDFYTVFDVGTDDKHIAPIDEGGVALAAIQGLNQKLDEKDVEIQTLKQQNNSLVERLNELEATVKRLVAQK